MGGRELHSDPAKQELPYFILALSISHLYSSILIIMYARALYVRELEGGDGIVVYEHTSHSSDITKKALE